MPLTRSRRRATTSKNDVIKQLEPSDGALTRDEAFERLRVGNDNGLAMTEMMDIWAGCIPRRKAYAYREERLRALWVEYEPEIRQRLVAGTPQSEINAAYRWLNDKMRRELGFASAKLRKRTKKAA